MGTEPKTQGSAILSDCGRYRYLLCRSWGNGPAAVFIMLNPSTADASRDDPTIRRLAGKNGFARRWGCGSVMVVNLYAWRATDPRELWRAADPVGKGNDAHLYAAAALAAGEGGPVVAAWGTGAKPGRVAEVLALPGVAGRLSALAVSREGHPKHPLYLKADLEPRPWAAAGGC